MLHTYALCRALLHKIAGVLDAHVTFYPFCAFINSALYQIVEKSKMEHTYFCTLKEKKANSALMSVSQLVLVAIVYVLMYTCICKIRDRSEDS